MASPAIALFGIVDLCGGLWTHFAMRHDARMAAA
jgi:hypothetical protein